MSPPVVTCRRFNPCCNGMSLKAEKLYLSIVDESFNPCCNGMSLKVSWAVRNCYEVGFNPCCNGMSLKGNINLYHIK